MASTQGRSVVSLPLDRRDVKIKINTSAQNAVITNIPALDDPAFETLISSRFDTRLVSGSFNISGTFSPQTLDIPERASTLQLLVHGITYTKNYWTGLDKFPQYSWMDYANKEGYACLAIDRLGAGDSDKPDPVSVVQTAIQIQILHQIIHRAREGTIDGVGGRKFERIVWVGHSYGSLLGKEVSAAYPRAIDALLVTGISDQFRPALPGIGLAQPMPASLVFPRYASLPSGYLSMKSQEGHQNCFYTTPETDFDPAVAAFDFATQGTVTVGELITGFAIFSRMAPTYTGPVAMVTGQEDAPFCGLGSRTLIDSSGYLTGERSIPARCRESLFPNASSYEFYQPPHTGHDLNFHYTAQETFKWCHDWMKRVGC